MKFVYCFIKTYFFVNRHFNNNDHLLGSELTVPIDRNATSQVKDPSRTGSPTGPIPHRQDIIRGEAMPVLELEQSEMATDRVKGFAGPESGFSTGCARRNRTRFGPTPEEWFGLVH